MEEPQVVNTMLVNEPGVTKLGGEDGVVASEDKVGLGELRKDVVLGNDMEEVSALVKNVEDVVAGDIEEDDKEDDDVVLKEVMGAAKKNVKKDCEDDVVFVRIVRKNVTSSNHYSHHHEFEEDSTMEEECAVEGSEDTLMSDNERNDDAKEDDDDGKIAKCSLVLIDLETNSLEKNCEILEIAAVYMNFSFKRYIQPTKAILPSASALNNLTFDGQYLYYKTKQVDAIPCEQAMKEFLIFLHQVSKKMNDSYIFLAAHNGDHFDFKHLFRTFREVNLIDAALSIIYGCLDSLLFLKELYPDLLSHKQEDLVKTFLGVEYTAHNALDDAKFLQDLLIAVFSDLSVDGRTCAVKWILPAEKY